MATAIARSLPSNVILPLIPKTTDAYAAHSGLIIFDCFLKILELNKTVPEKPRGKRATKQIMKLTAHAVNRREQLLEYLGGAIEMKQIADQEHADWLSGVHKEIENHN